MTKATEPKLIYYSGWLTAELCQRRSDLLFVFGDNLKRVGMGGQAVIRNEENVVGVATKRLPSMAENAFFEDRSTRDLEAVIDDLGVVWEALKKGYTVVIPVAADGRPSLGLERAELPKRAPSIYETIGMHIKEMANVHGVVAAPDGSTVHSTL